MLTFERKMRRITTTCAVSALLTAPALADPSVGFGLSVVFGGGTVETGLGLRVFSDDEEDEIAASIGIDYLFQGQSFRGTVGVAYLGDGWYIGGDVGLDLTEGGWDYGLSAGIADTDDDDPAPGPGPIPERF